MVKEYKLLDETFCFYCQKSFPTTTDFQEHVLAIHPNTYAYNNLLEELGESLE